MSSKQEDKNWYSRCLINIADNFGQAKLNRSDSVKKAMEESFDIKISNDQAKNILVLMSQKYKGKDRINYMTSRLSEIIPIEESECNKIACFLSNFKK